MKNKIAKKLFIFFTSTFLLQFWCIQCLVLFLCSCKMLSLATRAVIVLCGFQNCQPVKVIFCWFWEQKNIFVRFCTTVADTFRHLVWFVPNNVLPKVPIAETQDKRQLPRNTAIRHKTLAKCQCRSRNCCLGIF